MPCLHGSPLRKVHGVGWRPGGCGGREWGLGMLRTIGEGKSRQSAGLRCRFPERQLHLVDIENLAGASVPCLGEVRQVLALYRGEPVPAPPLPAAIAEAPISITMGGVSDQESPSLAPGGLRGRS
jgi:hypothetical protein